MRLALLLALTALSSAAQADGFRASLTGGAGVGRDFLGGQLEAGWDHWSVFAGLGRPSAHPDSSFAFGGRWSAQPDGSGFGAALQAAIWRSSGPQYVDYRETTTIVAATAHWRWLFWQHLVLDLGVGPAVSFDSYRFPTQDYDANNGKLLQRTCAGILGDVGQCFFPFDVELGLGLAF